MLLEKLSATTPSSRRLPTRIPEAGDQEAKDISYYQKKKKKKRKISSTSCVAFLKMPLNSDLQTIKSNSKVVTLSATPTALGKQTAPEETILTTLPQRTSSPIRNTTQITCSKGHLNDCCLSTHKRAFKDSGGRYCNKDPITLNRLKPTTSTCSFLPCKVSCRVISNATPLFTEKRLRINLSLPSNTYSASTAPVNSTKTQLVHSMAGVVQFTKAR